MNNQETQGITNDVDPASVDRVVIQSFATVDDAMDWMATQVDDPYMDNERFAFEGDDKANAEYGAAMESGCCGFFDEEIIVDGRKARIGCNFGH